MENPLGLSALAPYSERPSALLVRCLELGGEVSWKGNAAAVRALPVLSHVEFPVDNTRLNWALRA